MKKITIVSIASFVFLLLSSVVALITKGLFEKPTAPLLIGIGILLASGILAFALKEKTPVNIACFFISSIAMGFLIRAWYVLRGLENDLFTMMLISLSLVLYLWVFFAFTKIPFIKNSKLGFGIFTAIFVLLSLGIYLHLVFNTETTYLSTIGYYAIIEFAFIFAMCLEVHSREELIRNLTLSSYSVFVVAVIVAIFVILAMLGGDSCDCDCGDGCDGSCCDGCDLSGDFSTKSKKKRK